jgi:hypothetical protein
LDPSKVNGEAGLQIALQTGAQAIVTMDDQLINF